MPTRAFAACLLLGSLPAMAAEPPADVAAFVIRRDRCDHFRGEAADDPARRAAVAQALTANCRGTDAELARLLRRHAADPTAMALLRRYDPAIEDAAPRRR